MASGCQSFSLLSRCSPEDGPYLASNSGELLFVVHVGATNMSFGTLHPTGRYGLGSNEMVKIFQPHENLEFAILTEQGKLLYLIARETF